MRAVDGGWEVAAGGGSERQRKVEMGDSGWGKGGGGGERRRLKMRRGKM